MRQSILALILAFTLPLRGIAQEASAVAPKPKPSSFFGVRVLKVQGATQPLQWSATISPACPTCRLLVGQATSGQDKRGFFFHFTAPESGAPTTVHVAVDAAKVAGVVVSEIDAEVIDSLFSTSATSAVGMTRVPYTVEGDGITIQAPAHPAGPSIPPDDIGDVSEAYTYIVSPGEYVRIGHADEARRRGPYTSGAWPGREAKAALNLEFAAHQAVRELGLAQALSKFGVRTITIMNFDTNYPTQGPDGAHDDWPPHWHMHLYWDAAPNVRKVGHFYIGPDGLLTKNDSVTVLDGGKTKNEWFSRGERDETKGPDERVLYTQEITRDGHFRLTADSGNCLFAPVRRGFDSGVILKCSTRARPTTIRAEDDTSRGRLSVFANGRLRHVYMYDADTGMLKGDALSH